MPITSLWGVSPQFNDYSKDLDKFKAVLTSPALLKVFALQCDLFSLGRVKVVRNSGKEAEQDPAIDLLNAPNPFQSGSQFLWDFMFWNMLGNAHCYVDTKLVDSNKLYFLQPSKMEWPNVLENKKDKLIFSNAAQKQLIDTNIVYRYDDGTSINIPISRIISIQDLSNGTGNWFKGNSRIDALYKIISNSEAALDAENINIRYSGKFLVSGQADPKDVSKLPLTNEEKFDIETKMNGRKQVHAVKSLIDIKRFTDNLRNLELGKHYLESYYLIGQMYNIPKDVLEAYTTGATYENQEKATAKHISYTLQPKGNDFMQALTNHFGYTNKRLIITWDHLPFMQVFEKERVAVQESQIRTMAAMLKMGIDLEEINQFLKTDFKTGEYVEPKPKVNGGGNQGTASGEGQGN